ncbi:MAG: hypothetical protein V7722_06215, partial [Porticoccus sp.]
VEANGFYNAYSNNGITDYLIKGPYKFYEFCDDSPSLSRNTLFPEPGCFRVKKTNRVYGQCDDRVDTALSKRIVDPYPEFLQEYCIEVEKINKPEARYSYHSDPIGWLDKNGKSKFRRSDSYIKNTFTSEVVGRYVSYSYNVRPRHSSPKSCHSVDDKYVSYAEAKLIESVIKSSKE